MERKQETDKNRLNTAKNPNLSIRIRELRERNGLNIKELSDLSGVTQATISRIESGKVKELRWDSLKKLANSLAVSVDYLTGREPQIDLRYLALFDKKIHELLRVYADLSVNSQELVRDFAVFLQQRENKQRKATQNATDNPGCSVSGDNINVVASDTQTDEDVLE